VRPRVLPLLALTLLATPAPAAPPPAEEDVAVTVVAILATDRNQSVEESLQELAREVQKWHSNLTGFRVERTTTRSIKPGGKDTFPLVEEATVSVEVGPRDKAGRVKLTIRPPEAGEITYSCQCGRYFPVVTRYETKGKDRLIVAVMVKPCKLKKCDCEDDR
jgi:hypothetical protein